MDVAEGALLPSMACNKGEEDGHSVGEADELRVKGDINSVFAATVNSVLGIADDGLVHRDEGIGVAVEDVEIADSVLDSPDLCGAVAELVCSVGRVCLVVTHATNHELRHWVECKFRRL